MPWNEQVPAILEAWYPGGEDGAAVADVLLGDANPSGKLPITFPKSLDDVPAHTPEQYPGTGKGQQTVEHYSEGAAGGLSLVRREEHRAALSLRPRAVVHDVCLRQAAPLATKRFPPPRPR